MLSRPPFPFAVALAVFSALVAGSSSASQWNYTGADNGPWNTAANWTLNGGVTHQVPVIGDDAVLGLSLSVSNVTFNANYTGAGLNSLTLDSPGHASITLNQTALSTMIATNEYIGTTVSANTYNQSAGTNSTTTLYLGFGNGGVGTYALSGSGVLNAGTLFLGFAGTGGGIFNQSGGTNNIGSSLTLGQTGTNPTNAYNLSAGSIVFAANAGLFVGNAGRGAFNQSGGTVSLTGSSSSISIGTAASSAGSVYTLSGAGSLTGAGKLSVGVSGSGTLTQTGGTISLGGGGYSGNFIVAEGSGSTGIYNLSATTGTGSLAVDNLTVASAGNGTLNQGGGSIQVSNTFNLGATPTAVGSYTLTGGSVTVAANGTATIGGLGTSVFTQSGGTFTAPMVTIATGVNNFLANSTYNLSAGTLTTGSLNLAFNTGAVGIVNQTGGTVNVTAAGTDILSLGTNAGANGTYNIDASAGASSLTTTSLRVGDGGTGVFTQNGGTVTASAIVSIGRLSGSVGTYNLNGGALIAGVNPTPGNFFVGGTGNGTFNQTGGTVTVGGGSIAALSLGAAGGVGTYNLSGGSVTTPVLQSGNGGTGNFVQTGGAVNATQLNVSTTGGSTGSYTLSGAAGVTLGVSSFEAIGVSAVGTFTQNGGTHTLSGDIQLGQNGTGVGTYTLNGGSFNIAQNIGIGQSGSGLLQQTGGALTISNTAYIASGTGSSGTYNLSGGTAGINTAFVGYQAGGAIYQNGGALTVGTLYVGTPLQNAAGTGTYTHTSGALNVSNAFYLGLGGAVGTYTLGGSGILTVPNNPGGFNDLFISSNGTFTQYGGTVNGYVFNAGQFVFQGGTFNGTLENGANGTANFTNFVYFGSGLKNHGALNIPGGQVGTVAGQTFSNDGTITLSAGGQIYSNGPIVNNGLITGTGGLGGTSTFVNNLSITQGAGPLTFSFNPGNATNFGTITLASGRALNLYGSLTNSGTFALNGASVIQNGTLINAVTGSLTGPGTILAGFANSGVITPNGGTLNIAGAWTNGGVAQLGGLTDNLTGGTITNNGTIQGFGNVGAAVINPTGVIEAIGGSLVLGGAVSNTVGGTIAAGTGGKVVVSGGLGSNAGLINLTGGTFDNNNRALTNSGQISGYGVVRTGGAGLTNAGSITFTGGNTTVNGNVTNNVGQTIRISYNPATFTGNVVNNGTFKTTSTTSTFAGTFTNNGVFTSDPATQNFFNLEVTRNGALIGGVGDVFNVTGSLWNRSAQTTLFDLRSAQVSVFGPGVHEIAWSGADLGAVPAGFENNFALGILEIANGAGVSLVDGNEKIAGGAIYVTHLQLDGGLSQVAGIRGNGLSIYYDVTNAENGYLGGGTYALEGGGILAPAVPEPGTSAALALGALGFLALARRRRPSVQ